jgi:superoxide reductase
MKGFICAKCGHVAFDEAPERCPVCMAPKEAFEEKDAIKTIEDEGPGEKHVPVIEVKEKCTLSEGCKDIHVKVGDVLHPMEADHHIVWIDFYVDRKWVARSHLTPECNPAASLHLKIEPENLIVIEFCNLHGHWIGEG